MARHDRLSNAIRFERNKLVERMRLMNAIRAEIPVALQAFAEDGMRRPILAFLNDYENQIGAHIERFVIPDFSHFRDVYSANLDKIGILRPSIASTIVSHYNVMGFALAQSQAVNTSPENTVTESLVGRYRNIDGNFNSLFDTAEILETHLPHDLAVTQCQIDMLDEMLHRKDIDEITMADIHDSLKLTASKADKDFPLSFAGDTFYEINLEVDTD